MNWTDTEACRSGAHCATCRDPLRAAWRVSLATSYELPDDNASFSCPHGVPWSGAAPARHPVSKPPARGLGDTVARVIHTVTGITPCGGCKQRQETLNRLVPYDAQ